jgi:SPP1 gp7 family putative phage head morphogenesis protein
MASRFAELKKVIRQAVVVEDAFGLNPGARTFNALVRRKMTTPGRNAFAFPRSAEKVQAFTDWLETQQARGILESGQALGGIAGEHWTDRYIRDAYERGVKRARAELRRAGYNVPPIDVTGGIGIAMNQPFHAERVGLLFTRTFNDLKGITTTTSNHLSRVLAEGMARGENPRRIASILTKTISGQSDLAIDDTLGRYISVERRAKMLARTEIIRAHAEAQLTEFESWKVQGVRVQAEFITAGDDRVCVQCQALEGQTFTIKQAQGMIPIHVACRCTWIPLDITRS